MTTKSPGAKTATKPAATAKAPAASKTKRVMSDTHKEALRVGREHGQHVGRYLEALHATQAPKRRGRQVTVESLTARLTKAQAAVENASPIERLNLTQEISDIEKQLKQMQASKSVDIAPLEKEFIRVGKAYAANKKITRDTFVKCGVSKRVLEAAGI